MKDNRSPWGLEHMELIASWMDVIQLLVAVWVEYNVALGKKVRYLVHRDGWWTLESERVDLELFVVILVLVCERNTKPAVDELDNELDCYGKRLCRLTTCVEFCRYYTFRESNSLSVSLQGPDQWMQSLLWGQMHHAYHQYVSFETALLVIILSQRGGG